jgi:hypothetical protein
MIVCRKCSRQDMAGVMELLTIKKAMVSNGQEGFDDLYAELIKPPRQSTQLKHLSSGYDTQLEHSIYKLQEITNILGGKGM